MVRIVKVFWFLVIPMLLELCPVVLALFGVRVFWVFEVIRNELVILYMCQICLIFVFSVCFT